MSENQKVCGRVESLNGVSQHKELLTGQIMHDHPTIITIVSNVL